MSQAKCNGGMGFRDFSSFNRALLAKQGWRIQQCPDSLVARVLQAKYFQSKNFLDAKIGSNPSYIWRSILWGRKIICSGSRWRVVKPTLPFDAMVSELINEANCWDEKRIYEHFDKMDIDLITKIPLPRRPREDELIWHYGKNGKFSVKSGYQTALQIKFPAMPSSSVASKNEWNIIWSLALPQNIRIFTWRAAKNLLPSVENLWKKKILQEPTCQVCKMGMENVFHDLVACKSAKKNARNQLLFKGKRENPQIMVAKAEAMIAAYKRVHSSAKASINFEKNLVGLGAVIRDDLGHVTAAAIKLSKFHEDVSYAEAEAMEWGMLVAREAKVKAVIVESDSQGVVSLVNNKQGSRSEIYWVVSEIQKLAENFECVSIKYTPRSCNVIAHSLAKLALEKCETVVWKGSYPSQVMYLFSLLI
ncbi:putative reverse transcriptase/RNA-dependent DNA polymerase [Citrus sinensis]|nr:putative reverse transcriptase/RNA-dependent DNA polymerase [Citrus sinensis]